MFLEEADIIRLRGNLVDVHLRQTYGAEITIQQGNVVSIERINEPTSGYILPGFVDAHVHIESSMLVPTTFSKMAVVHGTVATVSDPHEIANVCGMAGVDYMLRNASQAALQVFFGAPSCVPATEFETAGASLGVAEVSELLNRNDIWYLSEMMNFPGVLHGDSIVRGKIQAALDAGKPVDGHAPGLSGKVAAQYASAGISTDHECTTLDEALSKVEAGMHILIREGSAARNFDALHPLIKLHPERVMFCSDDKHPDSLFEGHINTLVLRALSLGYDLYDTLKCASINPVEHYQLPVGLLRVGDQADLIVVDDLERLKVIHTWIKGTLVSDHGVCLDDVDVNIEAINHFEAELINVSSLEISDTEPGEAIRVIVAVDGELITKEVNMLPTVVGGLMVADSSRDLQKIVVVNRYEKQARPMVAFITQIGLKRGAIAGSIAHDSHHIIALGADDHSLTQAINAVIEARGGIALYDDVVELLPLPIAGLMSDSNDGLFVAQRYKELTQKAREMGCTLEAPFMTLSFMGLLVIPELKLSDRGLFDGVKFEFTDLYAT
jgi:adenine deaminase